MHAYKLIQTHTFLHTGAAADIWTVHPQKYISFPEGAQESLEKLSYLELCERVRQVNTNVWLLLSCYVVVFFCCKANSYAP
jgi:hypothetical protein